LTPLGIGVAMDFGENVGLGRDGNPQLWFGAGEKPVGRLHLAFTAKTRADARAFFMKPPSKPAQRTMAARACARTIIRTITGRL